jgi:hypothetical protein
MRVVLCMKIRKCSGRKSGVQVLPKGLAIHERGLHVCAFFRIFLFRNNTTFKPANVQYLDDKITRHARDAHKIISVDNMMWMKIHKKEK